jgi:hypothetical protein
MGNQSRTLWTRADLAEIGNSPADARAKTASGMLEIGPGAIGCGLQTGRLRRRRGTANGDRNGDKERRRHRRESARAVDESLDKTQPCAHGPRVLRLVLSLTA